MRVDFFIVGAMRSGTSSLRSHLDKDDRILMAKGEPIWFSNNNKFDLGIEEYHKLFADESKSSYQLVGEKSPPYAVSKLAPERVYNYNPEAKIIWMLRNPVKRAVSHFIHAKYRTDEALSLEEAISNASSLEKANSTMAYVYRSQYEKQIKKWSEFFPNQKIVIFEDLIKNTEIELNSIYNYLGMDSPSFTSFERHTRKSIDQRKAEVAEANPVSDETLSALSEVLKPTVSAIEKMIGKDLPDWR